MKTMLAAVLAAASSALIAQTQQGQSPKAITPSETPAAAQRLPGLSLDQAVSTAGG